MACAANYAWANRQVLMYRAYEVFLRVLGIGPATLGLNLVYDVCHNIAKKEEHMIDNQKRMVCVHRKGATRSFAPGHPAICEDYRSVGQPVIIPGDMGTASYVLAGTSNAMTETFLPWRRPGAKQKGSQTAKPWPVYSSGNGRQGYSGPLERKIHSVRRNA